jgi:hypothetical protein
MRQASEGVPVTRRGQRRDMPLFKFTAHNAAPVYGRGLAFQEAQILLDLMNTKATNPWTVVKVPANEVAAIPPDAIFDIEAEIHRYQEDDWRPGERRPADTTRGGAGRR